MVLAVARTDNQLQAGLPLAYIFADTPEERAELAETLKPVAEKHKGAVSFATIDAKAFGAHAANLNLEADKWPAFAIQETVKNQKFPYDQSKKLTAKDVGKFVDDFVAGTIKPSIKSEPIPEKQEGDVQVVVAHNYQDVVIDNEKDVLLEFYAPWCGHCKAYVSPLSQNQKHSVSNKSPSLAPKYEELAAMYTPDYTSKVTIAKVDATVNDVPDEISGFPTIKLFPAGGKSAPIVYDGSRTIEDLAAFVKENGKYKIDVMEDQNKTADEVEMPDADEMGKQAPAATKEGAAQKVMGKAKDAAEAVKTAVVDSDEDGAEHDEL